MKRLFSVVSKGGLTVLVLAVGLISANLLLIRQNLNLRAEVNSRRLPALEIGEQARPFTAPSVEGDTFDLAFTGEGPTNVLLYLGSSCPYTDSQFPYWCRVMEAASPERFRFIGVVDDSESLEEVEAYLQTRECDLSSRTVLLSKSQLEQYRLTITPSTLIIGNDGSVLKVWNGLWRHAEVLQAEEIFGPRLP